MKYEVIHGEYTRFFSCGNPFQACMIALKMEACDDDVQVAPFTVTNLETGTVEEIEMEEVVKLRSLANEHI